MLHFTGVFRRHRTPRGTLMKKLKRLSQKSRLKNKDDKRSRDRYDVELRFKVYNISAGQTSLLQVQ